MTPTEAQEAAVLTMYLRLKGYRFTHIPNETGHTPEAKRRAIRMKMWGTSKGFPDYLIIVKDILVFVELKRQKGGTVSPEQQEWITALAATGATARVCKGADEVITLIEGIEHDQQTTGTSDSSSDGELPF